jgi:glutamate--cysteine ligase
MSMQRLVRAALADTFSAKAGQPELVGLEVENGLVDPVTGCSIPYGGEHGARALLGTIADDMNGMILVDGAYPVGVRLTNGASFTLETGGALEYSSAPWDGLARVVDAARAELQHAAVIADRTSIALLSGACLPFTPENRIPWLPKPRVGVMRRYFSRLGDPGGHAEAVMGLTLSTQVSLDYVSAEDFIEKARLHVLASPFVAALSVNSPIAGGGLCEALSRRMQYWRRFDPRRCGVLGFALDEDASPMDFVDWAAGLPMIYRDVAGTHVAAPGSSFADLMRDGFGDGTWPTNDDWELHLCQLWPQVRPRGTLELRAADGLPWPYFPAVPAMWVGLTYDPAVRRQASALLGDLTAAQLECAVDDIAAKGLAASAGPYPVADLARELVRLARRGLESRIAAGAEPPGVLSFLAPLEQVAEDGETFADKCITSWQGELGQSPEAYVRKYRVPVG